MKKSIEKTGKKVSKNVSLKSDSYTNSIFLIDNSDS